jgi:hypothetical protein
VAILGIGGVLTTGFVQNLQKNVSKVFDGSSSSSSSSENESSVFGLTLQRSVTGITNGIKNINTLIDAVGYVDQNLIDLKEIVDDMVSIVKRASQSNMSDSARRGQNIEFRKLITDFQQIVDNAEIQGSDALLKEDLEGIFKAVGIDTAVSKGFQQLFNDFITAGDENDLASPEIKGKRPIKLITGDSNESSVSYNYTSLFDSTTNIFTRRRAVTVLEDLTALQDQLATNREVIDVMQSALVDTIQILRDFGQGVLAVEDQIEESDTAYEVAMKLKMNIQVGKRQALAQAENILPVIVKNLLTEEQEEKIARSSA